MAMCSTLHVVGPTVNSKEQTMITPRPRELGTNRQMAHHVARQPNRRSEPSDAALLAQARRSTRQWQARLAKQRAAEQQR